MYTAKIQCKNSTHCVLVHSMTIYMWACTQYLYNNSYLSLGRLGKIVNKDRIRNEGMRKYLVKVNIWWRSGTQHWVWCMYIVFTLSVMHVHCVYIECDACTLCLHCLSLHVKGSQRVPSLTSRVQFPGCRTEWRPARHYGEHHQWSLVSNHQPQFYSTAQGTYLHFTYTV